MLFVSYDYIEIIRTRAYSFITATISLLSIEVIPLLIDIFNKLNHLPWVAEKQSTRVLEWTICIILTMVFGRYVMVKLKS
jgi:hypothetical protein